MAFIEKGQEIDIEAIKALIAISISTRFSRIDTHHDKDFIRNFFLQVC